ncbi:transporter membrane subunit [Pseudomonas sp. Eqa60]|uniref:purine-cytosine permease family protein n=1 Tax=Pseudomonas sp. Eqa60 TaxID=2799184 RepID=UPI001BB40FF4|nr:cytosine permease [Pseudomonas sp. Eqa60]BCQ69631.1 transporter membrane subunit [Pseudomonas sp. Eqa60]
MATQRSSGSSRPAIEARSIDYVPRAERHGKVWHQGPFWFTGNFVFLTMMVGFVGPSMGLSIMWSVLAIVIGAGFGTVFMALHANQGPKMGLPQMIQSRAQFGSRGAIVPFAATIFVYIGFIVFGVILVTQAIQLVLPGSTWFWYPMLIAISIVIALVGYDLLHFVQRWLTYLLIAVFGIVTLMAVTALPAAAPIPVNSGWNTTAFLVQLSLAAGYNISYSVYVSDYSRYLPQDSSSPRLIFWTYLGATASAIWLMSLGAVLSSYIPGADGIVSLVQTGNYLFPGFGIFVALVGAVAQLSVTGINSYGAMLTGISAVDGFRPVRPGVRVRVIGLSVVGLLSLVIALALPDAYMASFNGFVLLMLYFLIPWTAVNLVDFYAIRKGEYAIAEIFNPHGVYGRWAWRGVLAYLVGFVAMVPFFSLPFFVGPVAAALGGADIAFIPGLLISGGLYFGLARNLERSSEIAAQRQSQLVLEGIAG